MADVLVLRTCRADMSAYRGFLWPTSGPVEAPDWDPRPLCGYGLHGALWGEGDGGLFCWDADAKWLVVSVPEETIVDLDGKVKFPRGTVAHCGDRHSATEYIRTNGGAGRAIIGATATAGLRGRASAGDYGTATAGYEGTATAGAYGTAVVGEGGTATAGYKGMATAGDYGTATAGDYGTATAGDYGTAMAGEEGELRLRWWDGRRYRTSVAYVGEDGILPNTLYKLNDRGEFVRAEK